MNSSLTWFDLVGKAQANITLSDLDYEASVKSQ